MYSNLLTIDKLDNLIDKYDAYPEAVEAFKELKELKIKINEKSIIQLEAPLYSKVFVIEDVSNNRGIAKYGVREKEYLLSDVASYTKIFNSYEEARKMCDKVNTKEVNYNGY